MLICDLVTKDYKNSVCLFEEVHQDFPWIKQLVLSIRTKLLCQNSCKYVHCPFIDTDMPISTYKGL